MWWFASEYQRVITRPGQIPAGKLEYDTCCPIAWPGVCCSRDALIFDSVISAAKLLTSLVVSGGEASECQGHFCRLRGKWMDGSLRPRPRSSSFPCPYFVCQMMSQDAATTLFVGQRLRLLVQRRLLPTGVIHCSCAEPPLPNSPCKKPLVGPSMRAQDVCGDRVLPFAQHSVAWWADRRTSGR